MKIAIVGSRSIENNSKEYRTIKNFILSHIKLEQITCVISGGARGVDTIARRFAYQEEIAEFREYLPQYGKYPGNKGYYVRNKKIMQECDVAFIFWDGLSRGSKMNADICDKMGKLYYLYNYQEDMPKNEREFPVRKAKQA
jgi:predicted Rossmann fold nucleotide-binding protein DprA/Smf involved in DNA uptake